MVSYKIFKNIMRCQTYTVPMLLKFVSDGNERLKISSTSDNLDDNIELDDSGCGFFVLWWRRRRTGRFIWRRWYKLRESSAESRVKINFYAAVFCLV
jgi:hypothetical protein